MGFEGRRSPNGKGKDPPPMWGTVFILVPYPTTVVISGWPNFTSIKSYMAANIGPHQGRGCAETYGTEVRGNLWGGLYMQTVLAPFHKDQAHITMVVGICKLFWRPFINIRHASPWSWYIQTVLVPFHKHQARITMVVGICKLFWRLFIKFRVSF